MSLNRNAKITYPPEKGSLRQPVAPASSSTNMHALEKKMVADVGLFRNSGHKATVDSLLRTMQQPQPFDDFDGHVAGQSVARQFAASDRKNVHEMQRRANEKLTWQQSSKRQYAEQGHEPEISADALNSSSEEIDRSYVQDKAYLRRRKSHTNYHQDDDDVIASMAHRLQALEGINSSQMQQLLDREHDLSTLRAKYERLRDCQGDSIADELDAVHAENVRLKSQIHEMESFLADYGLIWVGYRGRDATDTKSPHNTGELMRNHSRHDDKTVEYFPYDISKVIAAVKDLNALAGEGSLQIVQENGVSKFRPAERLRIVLFKDGMLLRSGPLRLYSSKSTASFFRDLLDGYFPFELKEEFPDGVLFDVVDRISVLYSDRADDDHTPTEAFLNRLPQTVISNGRVVRVRAGVADLLSIGSNLSPADNAADVLLVKTTALEALERSQRDPNNGVHENIDDIATIQVKSDDGTPVMIVKMRFTETVGDLRHYIEKQRRIFWANKQTAAYDHHTNGQRGIADPSAFEIRTTFPKKVYFSPHSTLQDEGLVPNAVVLLRCL